MGKSFVTIITGSPQSGKTDLMFALYNHIRGESRIFDCMQSKDINGLIEYHVKNYKRDCIVMCEQVNEAKEIFNLLKANPIVVPANWHQYEYRLIEISK